MSRYAPQNAGLRLTDQCLNAAESVLCRSSHGGNSAKYISYFVELQFLLDLGSEVLPDSLRDIEDIRLQAMSRAAKLAECQK